MKSNGSKSKTHLGDFKEEHFFPKTQTTEFAVEKWTQFRSSATVTMNSKGLFVVSHKVKCRGKFSEKEKEKK